MESKSNYTLVGLIVLILVAGLLSGGLWLSVGFDNKEYDRYTVYMPESASGLNDESIVKYNGVKVGEVLKIALNPYDPEEVQIQLKIVRGTPITISTRASLVTQGITGATYLGLSATSPSLIPLQKTPGEPYPVIPYKPSFFNQLERNINDITNSFKRIFDEDNADSLRKTLSNLRKVTDAIAENDTSLKKMLKDLPPLIQDLKIGVDKFTTMAGDLSAAGRHVSTTMKASRNTIDKFSQQAIPPAVILLERLDLIAANLEKVSNEMRQNPAVIIRGSAPPSPGPGE